MPSELYDAPLIEIILLAVYSDPSELLFTVAVEVMQLFLDFVEAFGHRAGHGIKIIGVASNLRPLGLGLSVGLEVILLAFIGDPSCIHLAGREIEDVSLAVNLGQAFGHVAVALEIIGLSADRLEASLDARSVSILIILSCTVILEAAIRCG